MLSNLLIQTAGKTLKGKQPYRPRPSNAGPERCIRALVYHALGIPESNVIGDRAAMTMDDSSWHEELSADWIRQIKGIKLIDQQREVIMRFPAPFVGTWGDSTISSDYCEMTGHIDGILETSQKYYLWEHKAINHFQWNRYASGNAEPLDYFTQCAFYMKALNMGYGILLMKNKNTAQYLDYVLAYSPDDDRLCVESKEVSGIGAVPFDKTLHCNIVAKALDRFRQVDQYVIRNTWYPTLDPLFFSKPRYPDRPHEIGCTFPCGYCTWEDTCWAGFEEQIRALGQMGEIPETGVFVENDKKEVIDFLGHYKRHLALANEAKESKKEYDKFRKLSVKYLISTGFKTATCGDERDGFIVSLRTKEAEGNITSAWVNVTFRDKSKRKNQKEDEE